MCSSLAVFWNQVIWDQSVYINYLRAKIMDFVSTKNPNYIKPVEGKKKDKQNQEFKPNKEMVQWVYDYFVGRSKLGEVT